MRKEVTFCIDPSTTCTGWAVFAGQELYAMGYSKPAGNHNWLARLSALQAECFQGVRLTPTALVVEMPQVYGGGKANPSSLIKVGAALGAVAACYADSCSELVVYEPHDWKGSLTKLQMCNRVLSKLDVAERAALDAVVKVDPDKEGSWCDVADAIGIGMKKLGRL